MKNLVIKITKYNWGMLKPGSFIFKEWLIYDDLSINVSTKYNNFDNNNIIKEGSTISDSEFKRIVKEIENAKIEDKQVRARDGSAWEIIYYNSDGSENWKRERTYIYGIKSLEEIASILEK